MHTDAETTAGTNAVGYEEIARLAAGGNAEALGSLLHAHASAVRPRAGWLARSHKAPNGCPIERSDLIGMLVLEVLEKLHSGSIHLTNENSTHALFRTLLNRLFISEVRRSKAQKRGGGEHRTELEPDLIGVDQTEDLANRDILEQIEKHLTTESQKVIQDLMDGKSWRAICEARGRAAQKEFAADLARVLNELNLHSSTVFDRGAGLGHYNTAADG